jgi:rubrerythrin
MFTAQDIFDIAIRLENNAEKTYREARRHTTDERLNTLLDWIADEEHNHARWFTTLKENLANDENSHLMADLSRALVEDVVQGQAFSLQEVDFGAIDTPDRMILTFIGFEDDTIAFYQVLKALVEDPQLLIQLDQIIAEEHKHIAKFREMRSVSEPTMTGPTV